jgi:malto-oligosyltrehalose synthase/4-alpha-glucanotransferase
MYNPISTYRIQFNKEFTFKQFLDLIDYFSMLGVKTIYASPVFSSATGSMHGYDTINPNLFSPEIGKQEEFDEIVKKLKSLNIGWLQDIVPNHMSFSPQNKWLMDVLEHGRDSGFALFFDIDFDHPDFGGKIILPFLGKPTEEAIETGEIKLSYTDDKIVFEYFDSHYPVNEESVIAILGDDINPLLKSISKKIKKHKFNPEEARHIINAFNDDISKLKDLLSGQHYKLTEWNEVDRHLNYRRFFAISGLISLQMDREDVFNAYHAFIEELVKENKIQGLRLDHIDGLNDPSKYIERLRVLAGEETYIIAEKILEVNENIPERWPLQGTSGYDFLVMVNNLLTYKNNYPLLQNYYYDLTGRKEDPAEVVYRTKKLILDKYMNGDLENLSRMFIDSGFLKDKADSINHEAVKDSISQFLILFPYYKLYSNFYPLSEEDSNLIIAVVKTAIARNPSLIDPLNLLQLTLLNQNPVGDDSRALNFFMRVMQYTGSLMAKGIEDTAMYDYNCFIAHNEVGDSIHASGLSLSEFHQAMIHRQNMTPLSINTTSTHDTKRGEDVRARLNVISELAGKWIKNVNNWKELNKPLKSLIGDREVPDINEEYFIYQTLTGIFPFNCEPDKSFFQRVKEYLIKALREAKINSTWNSPDDTYEKAVCDFVERILASGSGFLDSFFPFLRKISNYGIINSLTQVTLKATCPGIPDFYQGTEIWDFALVDPDNRRPVDFKKMKSILKYLQEEESGKPMEFLHNLYNNRENGEIKMWYTHVLMNERSQNPDLFSHGTYSPLIVSGKYKDHILAYTRTYQNTWYVIIAPFYLGMLNEISEKIDWGDTMIELPDLTPGIWRSIIGYDYVYSSDNQLFASEILKTPIPCILKGIYVESKRKAGILLHITSLPGDYGTGDIGAQAYRFIDFLSEAGQSYWQILPINPISHGSNYSPYSTSSAFAGNLLLLDPAWLVKNRLISEEVLTSFNFRTTDKSDFKQAAHFRLILVDEAFKTFKKNSMLYLQEKFNRFCVKEEYWLDDYVLFIILKQVFRGKSWNKWPAKIRDRDPGEIHRYKKKYDLECEREKFAQFLLYTQWQGLKDYANKKGISIIGDLSFYVSYDSVDVWQNPEVFKLGKNKEMLGSGGAPPDYFSKTGQLWNMPVYNWDNIKKDDFKWWRKRIYKNMEWFNTVRFDHFRGFSGYWEVPSGEETAVNGKWMEAPGNDFFLRLKQDFPYMPFIAEDLGDIDSSVYELRDKFNFPGMKVLQFAFNDTQEKSIHLPHNFNINSIVYTGTHDNNTTRGWFENELSTRYRKRAEDYTGRMLNGANVQNEFIRMAYASVSSIVIIPLQDVLGLGQNARFNNPGGSSDNWKWKLRTFDSVFKKSKYLSKLAKMYWRI